MPDDISSQNPYASPQAMGTPALIGEGEPAPSAPCPRCGQAEASPVPYRWWRGRQGPALMDHVQCPSCGAEYNGRTGEFNTFNNIVFHLSAVAAAALGLLLLFLLISSLIGRPL